MKQHIFDKIVGYVALHKLDSKIAVAEGTSLIVLDNPDKFKQMCDYQFYQFYPIHLGIIVQILTESSKGYSMDYETYNRFLNYLDDLGINAEHLKNSIIDYVKADSINSIDLFNISNLKFL